MRRWLIGLIGLLLAGGLGGATYRALLALPPATIEDAVAATLRQAGAPARGVCIENAQCVPTYETCLSFIADVTLEGEHGTGGLACAEAWRGCTLSMAEFGLRAAPVPDVRPPPPWITEIAEQLAQLSRRLSQNTAGIVIADCRCVIVDWARCAGMRPTPR